MADETWKIRHLVGATAQFAQGGGRVGLAGHDTDLGTWKCQLDEAGTFAIYARRNAAQSFTGLQTFNNGARIGTLTGVTVRMGTVAEDGTLGVVADAAAARTLIDAAASSHNQAYSTITNIPAALDAIDGLTPVADRIAYYTGANSAALAPLTAAARQLLDDTSFAAMVTTLGAISSSEKGSANGVAPLGSDSKVAATYLPPYIDYVVEVANFAALPGTGKSGKIYVTLDTNLTYRWSGSAYVEISASLALGETSSTAYRGNLGKTAYDHSQTSGNPHSTTAAQVGAVAKVGGTMTGNLTISSGQVKLGSSGNPGAAILYRSSGAEAGYIGFAGTTGKMLSQLTEADCFYAWETNNGTAIGERMRLQPSGGLSLGVATDPGAGNMRLSGLAGATIRPLAADTTGKPVAQDAATFRGLIAAQEALGYTALNKAGDTLLGQLIGPPVAAAPMFLSTPGVWYPSYGLSDPAQPAGQRNWAVIMSGSDLALTALGDTWTGGTTALAIERSGDVKLATRLKVYRAGNAENVVGPRKVGWTTITGTAQRSGFDTATGTITDVKQTLKALIDDLISHGLIGPT